MKRPLDSKRPLHLVMRSGKAKGELNFLRAENSLNIKRIINKQSLKYGVKIRAYANVGNHLHMMLSFTNRLALQNFFRSMTAVIARVVTKARRGKSFGKFWDALAFTRVVSSNKEKAVLVKYISANIIEAKFGRNGRKEFLASQARWEKRLYSQ